MRVKWVWGRGWNWRVYGSSRGNTGWLGGLIVGAGGFHCTHTHTAQCCIRISNIPQVSLCVWIMFLCIVFSKQPNSDSKKKQRHMQSFPQWFIHTPKCDLGETNLSLMHTDRWWLHTHMNSSLHWVGLKEKSPTEIDLLLTDWLNDLIQVFHQEACLHRRKS